MSRPAVSVLHALAPGAAGGLESVVGMLVRGQAERGGRVGVIAVLETDPKEPPFVQSLRELGVEVYPLHLPRRAYLAERRRIADVCGRARPDILHTHGYRPDVIAGSVGRKLAIPTVTTVHGFTGGDWKNRIYEWLQRRAFRRFDAVIAVSHPLAQMLVEAGLSPERVHCVPNAWESPGPPLARPEARRRLSIGTGEFLVGWVGRLTREKGADVLLAALALLDDPGLGLSVSFLGDGGEREALQQRGRALDGAPRIRWHGTMPRAGELFSAFDVFVLSSRTEGTPIVLFEAMAAGVPIVTTRVGGVPDVVSPAEALLVAPEDPAALAEAIRQVRADAEAARRRADRARRRLGEDFGVGQWLGRYEAIYGDLGESESEGSPG